MSEEKDTRNIYQRMLAVMKAVDFVNKSGEATKKDGSRLFKYASHDGVVAATRQAFIDNGILVHSSVIDAVQNGNRTQIKMRVQFINTDNPADILEGDYIGHGADSGDLGPGKAMSYAKKYAILVELLLETGDDPERDMTKHETDQQKADREKAEAEAKQKEARAKAWKPYQDYINEKKDAHPEIVSLDKFKSAVDSLKITTPNPTLDEYDSAWDACLGEMMEAIKQKETNNG
jgi:hypothetical protein